MMAIGSGVTLQVNDGDEVLEPYSPSRNVAVSAILHKRCLYFGISTKDRVRVAA
jgi:hypothetical protein